jgi:hypothetical protein
VEREGGVFCRQSQSSELYVADALGSRPRASLGCAHGSLCRTSRGELVWHARTWIETGFKDFKHGLWGWHHSKMQDASRVERLWLAMAVAQLWTVSLDSQAEQEQQQKSLGESLPARHIAKWRCKRSADQPPPRRLSCVVRGRLVLLAALFTAEILPCGKLLAEPGRRPSLLRESCRSCDGFGSASRNAVRAHGEVLLYDLALKTYT